MSRVLKPGGVFFLDGPNRLSPGWAVEDPHYRIAGISLLSKRLGKWWVVDVRKIASSYDVGVFPEYSLLVKTLRKQGLVILESNHDSYLLKILDDPGRIRSKLKRVILYTASFIGLSQSIAVALRNTKPSFWIVGQKIFK